MNNGNIGQLLATATDVVEQKDYSILNLGPTHPVMHSRQFHVVH
ncbi:MAG: hypothetical protein SH856_09880 [Flavobacteriales bacterium]|nr:hypothetical protein [Flavobacteriales bacterium]